jgi:hypothetical protein
MSFQVFTPAELTANGIKKSDVARMLARTEKLCTWHAKRHQVQGTTSAQQKEWDSACAKWDHLKATISQF